MNHDLRATFRILSRLELSKRFAERAFETLPGIHVTLDPSLRVIRANKAAAELLGRPLEDLIGDKQLGLQLSHELAPILSGETSRLEFEKALAHGKEAEKSFHWQVSRFDVSDGAQFLLNVVGQDITQLKGALRTLVQVEKDLDLARLAQELLLPSRDTHSGRGWKMAAHYEPASQAGGDWWRFEQRPDGSAVFWLGDVSGHGIGSAMVTALVTGCYNIYCDVRGPSDVKGMFEMINHQLIELGRNSYWMTLLALEYFPSEQKMVWTSASAPAVLVISRSGEVREFSAPGRPLGSGPLDAASGEFPVEPGDRVFCSTDGLYELNPSASLKALRRQLFKELQANTDSPEQAREAICERIPAWRAGSPSHDDIAFLIIDVI